MQEQQHNNELRQHLVAHRGYAARYTENTLAAVEAALQAGALYVEVDVQLSQDRQPLLFHDRNLMRLCRQPGAIHEYQWNELQDFSVWGQHQDEMKPEAGIPHLQQLVDKIRLWPEVVFFIELKRVSLEYHGVKSVVDTVLSCLKPVQHQCVMISYSIPALHYLREVSDTPLGVVSDNWQDHHSAEIQTLNAEYYFCDINTLPNSAAVKLPSARLVVFECIDAQRARQVLAQGVDLVETFAIGDMLRAMTKTT